MRNRPTKLAVWNQMMSAAEQEAARCYSRACNADGRIAYGEEPTTIQTNNAMRCEFQVGYRSNGWIRRNGQWDEEEYGVDGQWNRGTNGCNVAELIVM